MGASVPYKRTLWTGQFPCSSWQQLPGLLEQPTGNRGTESVSCRSRAPSQRVNEGSCAPKDGALVGAARPRDLPLEMRRQGSCTSAPKCVDLTLKTPLLKLFVALLLDSSTPTLNSAQKSMLTGQGALRMCAPPGLLHSPGQSACPVQLADLQAPRDHECLRGLPLRLSKG